MIDSVDSILMLYSYSGFPERGFALFDRKTLLILEHGAASDVASHSPPLASAACVPSLVPLPPSKTVSPLASIEELPTSEAIHPEIPTHAISKAKSAIFDSDEVQAMDTTAVTVHPVEDEETRRLRRVKRTAMSGLSILLTLMSIIVAFSISLITIMGLIGDNCGSCQRAADDPDGGGLAGQWWRGWAKVCL